MGPPNMLVPPPSSHRCVIGHMAASESDYTIDRRNANGELVRRALAIFVSLYLHRVLITAEFDKAREYRKDDWL